MLGEALRGGEGGEGGGGRGRERGGRGEGGGGRGEVHFSQSLSHTTGVYARLLLCNYNACHSAYVYIYAYTYRIKHKCYGAIYASLVHQN